MTHQLRDESYQPYPELELLQKLSQLEGCMKFLHHMAFAGEECGVEFPRNTTEKASIATNLERVRECRELFKTVLEKNASEPEEAPDIYELAREQFLNDS
jgi:hypothetical protein